MRTESSLTLMGSLINGVEHGNTEIPVKIDEISFDNIRVYPNPFTDYITIDAPNETISQIEIFDITGNLIRQQKTNVTPINLKELSDGIYILKITDAKDRTRKIRLSKQ